MAKPKIYKVSTTDGGTQYVRARTTNAARLYVARNMIRSAEIVDHDQLLTLDPDSVADAVTERAADTPRPDPSGATNGINA